MSFAVMQKCINHRPTRRGGNGQRQVLVDLLLGAQNRDFDGVEAIWLFLRDKRR
jgi:hypothetical protein